MATIHIDDKEYEVEGTENLLEACLSLGLDIPYFCWHPALGSVGSCRQCTVKQYQNADDKRGRLVMSCMTPASDGAYISIEDEEAVKFRQAVVEFLMTNHPHDCPVCEEGGNCHLQDMTVMSKHTTRRYRFNKRTHNNQELGPFIGHEMNRCIACYRCVRYYKDYAGGTDFGVYGAHDNVCFGRRENGTLESEFAGNLVEICPTGVFTDKTHSTRYNRKWDMQFAPSICQHCSVGCNINPGERYGELRRIENRFNGAVNHYFLCDRGRFGYGFVNLADRPRQPRLKQLNRWVTLNKNEGIHAAKNILGFAKGVVAMGSPRASLESNFALRELVGAENFYTGIEGRELSLLKRIYSALNSGSLHTPNLRDIEQYDAILILGEDVTQTAARIALAIRQATKGKAKEMAASQRVQEWLASAVQNIGQGATYPLFITSVDQTKLDDVATWCYHANIAQQAQLGFAIAHAIDHNAPCMEGIEESLQCHVNQIANALSTAKRPLIVTGTSHRDMALIDASLNVVHALQSKGHEQVGVTFVTSEANSLGLVMLDDKPVEDGLQRILDDKADTLFVMENDLYRRASALMVDNAIGKLENLIVLDHQHTAIMDKADLILSAATFAESDGTLVNQEGRVQRFFQVFDPSFYDKRHLDASGRPLPEDSTDLEGKSIILESWRWLSGLRSLDLPSGEKENWTTLDHVIQSCAEQVPALSAMINAAPNATFRIKGMRIAREPNRYSGRTSMTTNISVHEQRQPVDVDTAFVFSMEGYNGTQEPRQQIPFAWSPGWNSPQAWNKFQDEVGRSLRAGDPGIRLFEKRDGTWQYHDAPLLDKQNALHVVAYQNLFGSEELSQRAGVIQERMPQAYLMLSENEAQQYGLKEGVMVECLCSNLQIKLPLKISRYLSDGVVGLPLGFPTLSPILAGKRVDSLREVKE